MIRTVKLVRNVGQFDSATGGGVLPFDRLTLIHAENGRGKSTLAAILRSVADGGAVAVLERHRLGAQHDPHVVIDCDPGPSAVFSNGAWSRTVPELLIFDDEFVHANVHAGLVVDPEQRQKLHELILGAKGIALNADLQRLVDEVEAHNAELRGRGAAISSAMRGPFGVEQFCALPVLADIDQQVLDAERRLAAARASSPIRETGGLPAIGIPSLPVAAVEALLARDLPGLSAEAGARVQAHLAGCGKGAEAWVADGMRFVAPSAQSPGACPFCASSLDSSPVISSYAEFFGKAYADLKRDVTALRAAIATQHGGDAASGLERAVRVLDERRGFWSRFCELPAVRVDTAAIARDWAAARDGVLDALARKHSAPLEAETLGPEVRAAVARFDEHRAALQRLDELLQDANRAIATVKEQAASANVAALTSDLVRLEAHRGRHTSEVATVCDAYAAEKAAKATTEGLRDKAKLALNAYRVTAFPEFQTRLNEYLARFNAGFRLHEVTPSTGRGGATCTYNVLINEQPVAVGGATVPGRPSFRTALSAGDRNTLALAFFFASVAADPARAARVVVIDDPVSSLDEHRRLTTAQVLHRMSRAVAQIIVLSHDRPFLCRLWGDARGRQCAALQVSRTGAGSDLEAWDPGADAESEHDRRHALLREYVLQGSGDRQRVAEQIRPLLEAFLRVAEPQHCPPGQLLGAFIDLCRKRVGTNSQILEQARLHELEEIKDYANQFHHDTNAAWQTAVVNDTELAGFARRALAFTGA